MSVCVVGSFVRIRSRPQRDPTNSTLFRPSFHCVISIQKSLPPPPLILFDPNQRGKKKTSQTKTFKNKNSSLLFIFRHLLCDIIQLTHTTGTHSSTSPHSPCSTTNRLSLFPHFLTIGKHTERRGQRLEYQQ